MKRSLLFSVLAIALTGCGTAIPAMNAYGGAAISSTQQVNDSYAKGWAAAGCGITVGAALRNPEVIPALKVLCMPAAVPASFLDRPGRE